MNLGKIVTDIPDSPGRDALQADWLFRLSPDLMCVIGFDGYFKQLNPAWDRVLGRSAEELLSRPFLEFVHPDDVAATIATMRRLQDGPVLEFENRYKAASGDWRWLRWSGAPSPDRTLAYAVARDVTELRETRIELEAARRFAQRAMEVMPCVLYVFDLEQMRPVYINRAESALLGQVEDHFGVRDAEAVRGMMHPEDWPRFVEHKSHLASLRDDELRELTYRMRHADGSWRWFYSRDAVFARNADGSVSQFIGTATDVTAIKLAELNEREHRQRLDFALAAANMGVWETDIETGASSWSEQVARVMGMTPEQAPKSHEEFLRLMHPEDRERERQGLAEALANRSLYHSEFRRDLPDGQVHWIAAIGRFTYDASGRPLRLLGLAWDITAKKRAEEERLRLESQLRQSQKMEALGALAGGIAHDFNNILTAISGNARLALEDLPNVHPAHVCVEEVLRGSMRAADLVRRILSFSRKDEPELQPINLQPVIEEAVRLLRSTVPAMIDIRFQHDATPPTVLADATAIHQVVMNLGANARDALGERGGVLNIALRKVRVEPPVAALTSELRGEHCLLLSVSDNGPGMSAQTLERAFEPFFTTKPSGRGTGMGLAMVHGIVRRHGGVVLAHSEPGRGARFDLYFPIVEQASAPAPAPTPAAATPCAGGRILYVDDEEPLVFLATRMLTRMGFSVTGRTDARQALREIESDPARYDLIITDLGMPGMSGLDFAEEIMRLCPATSIIITSGYVRPEDAARARAVGALDIVLKPNTVEEMVDLISAQLNAAKARARNA